MKVLGLLGILSVALFTIGCNTEIIGPPGRDGIDGLDGLDGEQAYVFEYEIDFTSPDYRVFLPYKNNFQALESDVALVYFLWEVDNEGVEIWRPLPQNLFLQQGILQYNFDFTRNDVSVFLDATFALNTLGANLTDDWIVRVVVVPSLFGTNGRFLPPVNHSDYNKMKEFYKLPATQLAKPGYRKLID